MKEAAAQRLAELMKCGLLSQFEVLKNEIESALDKEYQRLIAIEEKRVPKKSTIGRICTGLAATALSYAPVRLFTESLRRMSAYSLLRNLQRNAMCLLSPYGTVQPPGWLNPIGGACLTTENYNHLNCERYGSGQCIGDDGRCYAYSDRPDTLNPLHLPCMQVESYYDQGSYTVSFCSKVVDSLKQSNPATWATFTSSSDALESGDYSYGGWFFAGGVAISLVIIGGVMYGMYYASNLDQVDRNKIPAAFLSPYLANHKNPALKYLFDLYISQSYSVTVGEAKTLLHNAQGEVSYLYSQKKLGEPTKGCGLFRLNQPKENPEVYEVKRKEKNNAEESTPLRIDVRAGYGALDDEKESKETDRLLPR